MTEPLEASWKRRFERYALLRDDDAGIAGWSAAGLATRLHNFEEHWRSQAGARWLDIGCGAGNYTRHMVAQGSDVVAIDYSLPTLEKARRRSRGVRAWIAADANSLPIADAQFDGAICFGVLQALSSPDRALAELHRCVRPGGEVWVDALNGRFVVSRVRPPADPYLRLDDPQTLLACCRRAGLEPMNVYWLPIIPARHRWLARLAQARWLRALLAGLPALGSLVSHAFVVRMRRPGEGTCP